MFSTPVKRPAETDGDRKGRFAQWQQLGGSFSPLLYRWERCPDDFPSDFPELRTSNNIRWSSGADRYVMEAHRVDARLLWCVPCLAASACLPPPSLTFSSSTLSYGTGRCAGIPRATVFLPCHRVVKKLTHFNGIIVRRELETNFLCTW